MTRDNVPPVGSLVPVLVVLPTAVEGGRGGGVVCMALHDFVSDYIPWWEQVERLAYAIPDATWRVVWCRGPLGPQDLHRVAEAVGDA